MKPGKPNLSSKLTDTMNDMKAKQLALTQSHLKTFEDASKHMLARGLNTIESDINSFVKQTADSWNERLRWMDRLSYWHPWMIAGAGMTTAAFLIAMSFLWMHLMNLQNWASLGLSKTTLNGQVIILLDDTRITAKICTIQDQPITCLIPEEKK